MPDPAVADLTERLATLDDPRHVRGIRHEIGGVLAVGPGRLCAI